MTFDWVLIAITAAGALITAATVWALRNGYGWDTDASYYNRNNRRAEK